MSFPWLRADAHFFGVGTTAEGLLRGIVPPPLVSDQGSGPANEAQHKEKFGAGLPGDRPR
jgi:hypothetical protein